MVLNGCSGNSNSSSLSWELLQLQIPTLQVGLMPATVWEPCASQGTGVGHQSSMGATRHKIRTDCELVGWPFREAFLEEVMSVLGPVA